MKPPKVDERIMPAQDEKSLEVLLSHVDNTRDRAIISTLIDSSGRLSEVSNISELPPSKLGGILRFIEHA